MDALAVLGGVGTFIGLVRALPQLVRLLRARNAHGVSLDTAATSCVVSSAWAGYGFLTQQLAVALASGLAAAVFGLITLLALRFGRHVKELRAAPIWLTVVVVVTMVGKSSGLGLVLSVSALVANVPQVVVAYRERDLTGLSASTWALTASDGTVWFLYGVLAGDIPIFLNNFFQLTTSVAILVRRLTWERRRARLGLGEGSL